MGTRPPISHTTSAQMRPFMTDNPNIFQYEKEEDKVKKLMIKAQKMQRTKSEVMNGPHTPSRYKTINRTTLRPTKSDPNLEYQNAVNFKQKQQRYQNGHNRGDPFYVNVVKGLQTQTTPSPNRSVDYLKSLKKKKRKQHNPIRHPVVSVMDSSDNVNRVISAPPPNLRAVIPSNHKGMNLNPASFKMNMHPQKLVSNETKETVKQVKAFNPKKSKLNANAASYKPFKMTTNASISPKKAMTPSPNPSTTTSSVS